MTVTVISELNDFKDIVRHSDLIIYYVFKRFHNFGIYYTTRSMEIKPL